MCHCYRSEERIYLTATVYYFCELQNSSCLTVGKLDQHMICEAEPSKNIILGVQLLIITQYFTSVNTIRECCVFGENTATSSSSFCYYNFSSSKYPFYCGCNHHFKRMFYYHSYMRHRRYIPALLTLRR